MDTALTMWTLVGQPKRPILPPDVPHKMFGTGERIEINNCILNPDDNILVKAINKAPVLQYDQDIELDRQQVGLRDDYTTYGEKHAAATTVLYSPPVQGWQASSESQLRRLQLLKQSYAMPAKSPDEIARDSRYLDVLHGNKGQVILGIES